MGLAPKCSTTLGANASQQIQCNACAAAQSLGCVAFCGGSFSDVYMCCTKISDMLCGFSRVMARLRHATHV
eukprot:9467872-Pyramimonas_sp.AAC.1